MTRRARELEMLLLAMFAAVPLYFTYAVSTIALVLFHAFTGLMVLRVLAGRSPELVPASIMRWVAIAYVPFYIVDWMVSRSAIAASTHLVLFIAAYQPIEAAHRQNHAQRLLTTALIFIASIATSTHLTIVPFIVVFAFFVFRQLMHVSHEETARSIGREYGEAAAGRAAAFYLAVAMVIGTLLFPLLPRLRNPLVRGLSGPLAQSATSLSETINFSDRRAAQGDATVLARVWMSDGARARFAPLRLRGMIYDHYQNGEWRQTLRGLRQLPQRGPVFSTALAGGDDAGAIVEMRAQRGKIFLPSNTYSLHGVQTLYEGPARETYYSYDDGPLRLEVRMATEPRPLRASPPRARSGYPISPAVETLARTIVGNEQEPARKAALIEQYMVRNFRYVPNDQAAEPITLEQFLLVERGGHCEYFAAGMVALLDAVGVQARIAGGFYGGQMNPLTGYYTIRREDAHAWTEVWTGTRWATFDGTPPAERPGATRENPLRLYAAALGDSLTFFWDRYVLTFGLGDQVALFEDLVAIGGTTIATVTDRLRAEVRGVMTREFVVVLGAIAALVLAVRLVRRRRRPLFDALASYLAAQGIAVGPAMTMEEALRELRAQHPGAAEELAPLIALYEQETFGARPDRRRARTLKRRLAQLRT